MTMKSLILFVAILWICESQSPDQDLVTFPGWPSYDFKTYSGYLNVTGTDRFDKKSI